MAQASSLLYDIQFGKIGSSLYPRLFHTEDSNILGQDSTGNTYTIEYANGCDQNQQLWYAPVGYQDASGTNHSSPDYDGNSDSPASPISSDVVLFTISGGGVGYLTSLFCAVLTNSDADPSDQLYTENPSPVEGSSSLTLNSQPGGYHQCN